MLLANAAGTMVPPNRYASDLFTEQQLRALMNHAPYQALRGVAAEFNSGVAVLYGDVPSYYLKQIAQSIIATVDGVEEVVNRIVVRPSSSSGQQR